MMSRIDGWTDDHVDYAIRLLVEAGKVLRDIDSELWEQIERFLREKA